MEEKIACYRGKKFRVFKEVVYKPAEDTFLLADNLRVKEGDRVLELGTGCGILSILAAEEKAKVVATDISQAALECARKNAKTHGVFDKIEFRRGNLFEPIKNEKFDIIIFNPPYLPVPPSESLESVLDGAWNGGPSGRKIIDHFLEEVNGYLKPRGRFFLIQSSLSGTEKTLNKLEGEFKIKMKEKKYFFEEINLFICKKR